MNLKEALELVETFSLVDPGPRARFLLEKYKDRRGVAMSYLKPVEMMGERRCAWCEEGLLRKKQQKYCTKNCANSALIYFYPQNNVSKMFHLIFRQGCACAACGQSMEEEVIEIIKRKYKYFNEDRYRYLTSGEKKPLKPLPVGLWAIGYGTGHRWQVDHAVPLFKGGAGLGVENIQILCVECHGRKSVAERKGF